MSGNNFFYKLALFVFLCVAGLFPGMSEAAPYKVLVVMSYHETMPWEKEIRDGIESVLARGCTIKYFYMNTKNNFAGGEAKAKEAYEVYRGFHPDGIIAADDDAQSMFVVPYMKDKVNTPVMFCGVNAEPEKYGYPASNVSGILERAHFRESIAFLQQFVPSVKTFSFLTNDNSTGKAYVEQIRHEAKSYPVKTVAVRLVKTIDEAVAVTRDLKNRSDALFVIAMEGLADEVGRPLQEKDIFRRLASTFGKPVIGMNEFNIRSGLLCSVVKTGQEQGATAAKMLLKAVKGTPVLQIPITRNKHGKRILNVSVMKSLGIKPRPVFLVGAELVNTEND